LNLLSFGVPLSSLVSLVVSIPDDTSIYTMKASVSLAEKTENYCRLTVSHELIEACINVIVSDP
jgi:hypothetical protein